MKTNIHRIKHTTTALLVALTSLGAANAQTLDVGNGRVLDLGYKNTDEGRPRLTAYLPQSSSPTPVVLYVHGGGWAVGDRDEVQRNGTVRQVAQGLLDRGIAVASVDYRFATENDNTMRDCITDAKDAIRFMTRHQDLYNIDPNQVATWGQSAGGHIASVVALSHPTLSQFIGDHYLETYNDFRVQGCVNWYGPSTFRTEHFYVWDTVSYSERVLNNLIFNSVPSQQESERNLVSPYTYMVKQSPPLAIYHGTEDGTIPVLGSRLMRDRANAVGNPLARYKEIAETGHNLGDFTSEAIQETIDLLSSFVGVSSSFVPDPSKEYHIDVAANVTNVRVSASGSSEDALVQNTSKTGTMTRWKFVPKGNGFYHIDRATGGTKPRLRTDNSTLADMQPTSSSGSYTYYEIAPSETVSGAYYLTLPDGPTNYKRLQVNSGLVKFVSTASKGTQVSFFITEAN